MRKQLLFLTLATMLGPVASARSLSPAEALSRVPNQHVSRSGAASPVLTVGSADAPALYVFNNAGGGYMIVSADDVAAPLLGYSNNGTFDPENMPENLRYWLEQYKEQITEASEAGAEAYAAARTSRAASDRTPIAPLVKTKWNQDRPYWNDCPLSYGVNTYTGCVATAMAQIMKYHNWPQKANDNAKFSYKWAATGETLTADFSNFEFDWDNMLDEYGGTESYNATQADAVAKLMQACGYSVRMIYSTTASAAYSEQVGGALATYFGYDQGLHNEFRELHTSAEWEEMIYNNLKDCGPMVYWGSGGGGAHCFVCDGYDTNGYFHFNWGWSGMSDGYFLLNALAPGALGIGGGSGGGFSNAQGALLGIKPAGATESPRQYTFRINELSGADTGTGTTYLYLRGEFTNLSPFVVDGAFKYRVYNYDGSIYLGSCAVYTPGCKNWGVDIVTGNTIKAGTMMGSTSAIPTADGTYRVYPAVEIDGQEYMFQSPPTIAGYVLVTRQLGTITKVTVPSAGELQTLDLNTHGDYFVNAAFKFSGIAKFTGNGDTNQNVIPCLLNPDGSVRATGNWFTITFSTEGTPFEFVNDTWFSDKGETIAAGNYTFCLATTENGLYKPITGAVPVTVNSRVSSPTFKCTDLAVANADAVNPDDINITASFEGETGVTYRSVIFTIFKGINSVWKSDEILYVSAGQKVSLPVKAALTGAQPGDRYYIYAAIDNRGNYEYISDQVFFTIGDQSGIADIEADDNAPAEYFNLQGIRVSADKLAPGIYIKRQGSKTTKILVK